MKQNIVLVGLSGSGKTTVGKLLNLKLSGFDFVDTDELIVEKEKKTINEIFSVYGEEYFRKVESEIIAEIASRNGLIVSTGGGIVLKDDNIKMLKTNGVIFYLKTAAETLSKRLEGASDRPLLNVSDIKSKLDTMLSVRGKKYEQADFIIETDKLTPLAASLEIMRYYNDNEKN